MSALITITWPVPVGYDDGDYAMLYGNSGIGDIDYDTPLSTEKHPLFIDGGGIYGFGHTPFGHSPFGHPWSTRVAGFGYLPFGHSPFGYGTGFLTIKHEVFACGDYKFALKVFDKLGNTVGDAPQELTASIHIAPPTPTGLRKNSYDSATKILILDAA